MIAKAMGAMVIAIDINDVALSLAKSLGADYMVNASEATEVAEAVKELSHGGVHLSIDALGSKETCFNSIKNLRKQGRHIQVGLMAADDSNPPIPMAEVIANELEILGSHGMQAHQYPAIFKLIEEGNLQPEKLVGKLVNLDQGVEELINMNSFTTKGITVINSII